MAVRNIFATAMMLGLLLVTPGLAQSEPAAPAAPAHPFLGLDIAPNSQAPDPKAVPAQQAVPNGPAAPSVAPTAPAAAPQATPAQPGKTPALPQGHPVVVPEVPGTLEIITDPRAISQLFGRTAGAPFKPTPEMLESVYVKVWQQVAQSYHDPARLADWYKWADKYKGKLQTEEDLEKALKDMLGSLNDPWTKYISTTDIKQAQENAKAGISDLGIWIVRQPDGSFKVDYTTYGTPSYTSGIHKGDVLVSAGGKPLKGLSLEEAQKLLEGKDGSTIEVVYSRNGKEQTEKLVVAAAVEAPVVARLIAGTKIGYIRLPGYDNQNFGAFVQGLQKIYMEANGQLDGLIFDQRGNSGGLVNLALQVASIFMEKGTVVNSTTREGRMVTHQGYEVIAPQKHDFLGAPQEAITMIKDFHNVPMIVLVDGSSASSAEIVTGALKDSGRATILGTTTYGKGVGYNTARIPPGGVFYITSMDYLTPSGYNLSNKGIPPHVVVERTPGSKTDEQLDAAIARLKAQNPNPITSPAQDDPSKKQFGEGSWESNPLAIAAFCGLAMLAILFLAGNHYFSKRRREEEAKRDRESE